MTVRKPFFKISCCLLLLFGLQISSFASNHLQVQTVKPAIVNPFLDNLVKEKKELPQKLELNKFWKTATSYEDSKPISPKPTNGKVPRVVIDDVIVFLNEDFSSDVALLSCNDTATYREKLTLFSTQKPG